MSKTDYSDLSKQSDLFGGGSQITALYERISQDDASDNTISSQKKILEDYATQNSFPNPVHFTDYGYTGTRFDRPGLEALLTAVNEGTVSTVIVQDLSRLGRDHLKVGMLVETLRQKGVRLIALSDSIDTFAGEEDFAPLRTIMNEWFARRGLGMKQAAP